MKTKPILFSTEMVRAILSGNKTKTRREIKSRNQEDTAVMMNLLCGVKTTEMMSILMEYAPYQIGDILWVRETWKIGAWNHEEEEMAFDYKASPELKKTPWVVFSDYEKFAEMTDKAIRELDALGIEPIVNEKNETFYYKWEPGQSPFKWKPSIFMPKEAARIFLKVTDVRIECLHHISAADAIAEGIKQIDPILVLGSDAPVYFNYLNEGIATDNPIESFKSLWQSINGKESWERNPLIWVVDFEVLSVTGPDNLPAEIKELFNT